MRSRRSYIFRPVSDGLAEYQKFALPYTCQFASTGTGSQDAFRGNSIFDPSWGASSEMAQGTSRLFAKFSKVRVDWADVYITIHEISGPTGADWVPVRTVPFWMDVVHGTEDEYKTPGQWPHWHSEMIWKPAHRSWMIPDLAVTGKNYKYHFRHIVSHHIPHRKFGRHVSPDRRWHNYFANPLDTTIFSIGFEPCQQRAEAQNKIFFRCHWTIKIIYHGTAFDKIHTVGTTAGEMPPRFEDSTGPGEDNYRGENATYATADDQWHDKEILGEGSSMSSSSSTA